MKTAEEMLEFIERNEAWLTFASAEKKQCRWRCYVAGMHFASPDRRERSERIGHGKTAREAIHKAMQDEAITNFGSGLL